MKYACGLFGLLAFSAQMIHAEPGKITRFSFESTGQERTCFLYVPKDLPSRKVPLIVMLHGSGRDGSVLLKSWERLAAREKVVLAGPNALNRAGWTVPGDGPVPIYDLVEKLRGEYPIDDHRMYLFGHSAGATYALMMGLLEPGYFAAGAVSAGALPQGCNYAELDPMSRKIPFWIVVGTRDAFFPINMVRATRDYLTSRGYPVELKEIDGHDHNYYRRSQSINEAAWTFLCRHALEFPPYYTEHPF